MNLAKIEDSVRKLSFRIDERAAEWILGDALAVIGSVHVSPLRRRLSAMRIMRRSLPVRLAGAAIIIAVAYAGAEFLAACLEGCSDTTALTIELASNDIVGLFGS